MGRVVVDRGEELLARSLVDEPVDVGGAAHLTSSGTPDGVVVEAEAGPDLVGFHTEVGPQVVLDLALAVRGDGRSGTVTICAPGLVGQARPALS